MGRDLAILEQSIDYREHAQGPILDLAVQQKLMPRDHTSVHDEESLRALQDLGLYRGDGRGHLEDVVRVRERTQLNETKSLFRRAKMAFTTFLTVAAGTSIVLLYGAYLALAGHVASGIVVALCSAVPGTFSLGLYRLQTSADKRANEALKDLTREVEREALIQRTFVSAREVKSENSREALEILGTLRAVMPDASPAELASLLAAVRRVEGDEGTARVQVQRDEVPALDHVQDKAVGSGS
jgi:hypothetical protein